MLRTYNRRKDQYFGLDEGLGNVATNRHQQLIMQFIQNLSAVFPVLQGHLQTETNVVDVEKGKGNKGKRFPDITLWQEIKNYKLKNVLLVVEITSGTKGDGYSSMVIKNLFSKVPSLREAFIYNYNSERWKKFVRVNETSWVEEENDYSKLLGLELSDFFTEMKKNAELGVFDGKIDL